jgi:hypothetical protein
VPCSPAVPFPFWCAPSALERGARTPKRDGWRFLGAALAIAGAAAGCGGDGGLRGKAEGVGRERAEQARRLARDAGLGEDVGSFLATAAGAVGHAFTVEYDTGDGGRLTVDQDPPLRRVDVTGGQLGPIVRSSLVNEDGAFSCERRDGTTACLPTNEPPPAVGPFSATDLERTVSSLTTAQRSYTIVVEHRSLASAAATCLVTTRRPEAAADADLGERGELCVAETTGAPLLVDQPGQHLAAVTYRAGVRKDVFRLPGPLVTTPSTTR